MDKEELLKELDKCLRIDAMDMAIRASLGGENASTLVARAKGIYNFLNGGTTS